MYNGTSLRDEEKIGNVTLELDSTQDSLKRTHSALQEYNIYIEKLHEKLETSHSSSYTSISPSIMVDFIHGLKEEPHVMVVHEVHGNLHVYRNKHLFFSRLILSFL